MNNWVYGIAGFCFGIEFVYIIWGIYTLTKAAKEKRAKQKEYIEQLEKENRELKSKLEAQDDNNNQ